jgi:hypothetical protein
MKVSADQNTVEVATIAVFVEGDGCSSCCFERRGTMCMDAPCHRRTDGRKGNFKEVTPCK